MLGTSLLISNDIFNGVAEVLTLARPVTGRAHGVDELSSVSAHDLYQLGMSPHATHFCLRRAACVFVGAPSTGLQGNDMHECRMQN